MCQEGRCWCPTQTQRQRLEPTGHLGRDSRQSEAPEKGGQGGRPQRGVLPCRFQGRPWWLQRPRLCWRGAPSRALHCSAVGPAQLWSGRTGWPEPNQQVQGQCLQQVASLSLCKTLSPLSLPVPWSPGRPARAAMPSCVHSPGCCVWIQDEKHPRGGVGATAGRRSGHTGCGPW